MKRHFLEGMKLAMAALAATILLALGSHAQAPRVSSGPESKHILEDLHTHETKSLKGLSTMTVVGEIVAANRSDQAVLDAMTSAGLKVEEIERVALDQLNRVQFKILPKQQWNPNQAFLKVKVEFGAGTTAKGSYIGFVKVALAQPVALQRQLTGKQVKDTMWQLGVFDVNNLLLAETWHTQRPFNAKDTQSILGIVEDIMKDFVIEYTNAK